MTEFELLVAGAAVALILSAIYKTFIAYLDLRVKRRELEKIRKTHPLPGEPHYRSRDK